MRSRDAKKESAAMVLETIPGVMRSIGTEMRRLHKTELSPIQFRAMSYINFNEGASLTDFAEFAGISLSAASKTVDGLVGRRLIKREAAKDDRRRIILSLTAAGEKRFRMMRNEAVKYLTEIFEPLTAGECATISKAMTHLEAAFAPARRDLRQGVKK
jgi:DNA-binding MarR family transcriptional regulator